MVPDVAAAGLAIVLPKVTTFLQPFWFNIELSQTAEVPILYGFTITLDCAVYALNVVVIFDDKCWYFLSVHTNINPNIMKEKNVFKNRA